MKRSLDDPQGFLERLKPLYSEMFRAAHAITGNLELAQFVLQNAMLEAYLRRGEWRDRMDFREGLMHAIRLVGLAELRRERRLQPVEQDWRGFEESEGLELDPSGVERMRQMVAREKPEMRRMLMLRYGCGLNPLQIAEVMQMRGGEVRQALTRCQSRLERGVVKPARKGGRARAQKVV